MEIDYKDKNKALANEELDNKYGMLELGKENFIYFYNLPDMETIVRYANHAGKHKLETDYNVETNVLTVRLPDRIILKRYYEGAVELNDGHNRMGCSENWYDAYYAITQTFTADEVDKMDEEQLQNLFRLADTIQSNLY